MTPTLMIAAALPAAAVATDIEALRALYSRGAFAEVVERGTALLAAQPDDREAHHLVGRALIDAGHNLRTEQAIAHLQRSMQGLPPDHWMLGWSHVYIGMAHEMAGRARSARDAYELALALDVTPECTGTARRRLQGLAAGAHAAVLDDMQRRYGAKDYAAVIAAGRKALQRARAAAAAAGGDRPRADIPDALFYHLLGRALIDAGRDGALAEASGYLETSLALMDERRWIAGWNHFYLGRAHEGLGDLEAARRAYERAVAIAATTECVNSARFRLRHLGRDPYADWQTYEMAHVILLYPPDSPLARNPAATGRRFDAAHEAVCRFLGVRPARKIRMYLYNDEAQGRDITGQTLGWADRDAQVVHQHLGQTAGHELTHCIAHHLAPPPYCDSVLLDEGLAVYLDHSGRDHHARARELLAAGQLPTVEQLERTFRSRDDAYPLGGSFVGFLLERYSLDLFKALWRDSAGGASTAAFKRHYNMTPAELDEAWRAFLREAPP